MEPCQRVIRDYTAARAIEDASSIPPEELALVSTYLHRHLASQRLPHMIDPIAAAEFDRTVNACDAIAKEFSGRLEATVDFNCYDASIALECAYIEFRHGEFMETLRRLTTSTTMIQISSMPSPPLFRIELSMPYFLPLTGRE